ncbi:MAG: protein translocase subunit SecDF, partial [Solobacterium sp.]|nr:protein translocase subunit SecDF [Solobacterium sp.]
HDVLITLAMFTILRLEVNTEVISVLLTIIGYSINNSIIVFDRVRETVAERKGKINYRKLVNDALDKTLLVSIFSSITTLLPVIMLLLLGSRSIFTFTFAMLTGMIAGTFSSIFVAPRLWCWIRENYKPKQRTKKKKEQKETLDEYTIKGINA